MATSRLWTCGVIVIAASVFTADRATAGDLISECCPALLQQGEGRAENAEVREVRRRLRVMRTAVEVLLEAGKQEAAHMVEHAMHSRELALERRDDAEARKIRESAPDRAALAELLGFAARLHAQAGHEAEARPLAELAEVYREQAQRRAAPRGERERPAAEGQQDDATRALHARLRQMHLAAEAFREARAEREAEAVQRAMHALELQIELIRVRQHTPGREEQRELLQRAAALYREWGHDERALALAEPPRPGRGQEQRRSDALDLENLEHRIAILRMAHTAFREANRADPVEYLERFVAVAKMELAGVDGARIMEAAAGLDIGTTIELLQGASKLYREWDRAGPARACNALAEFYARRERQQKGAAAGEPRRLDVMQLRDRVDIWRIARAGFGESGWETSAATAERMVHIGELLLEDVGAERLREVAEGLPDLADRVVLLEKAAELHTGRGAPGHARACLALAKYYAQKQ